MDHLSLGEFLVLVFISFLPTMLVCTPLFAELLKRNGIQKKVRLFILFAQVVFIYFFGLVILTYCPLTDRGIPDYLFVFDTTALFGELVSGLVLFAYCVIGKYMKSNKRA